MGDLAISPKPNLAVTGKNILSVNVVGYALTQKGLWFNRGSSHEDWFLYVNRMYKLELAKIISAGAMLHLL